MLCESRGLIEAQKSVVKEEPKAPEAGEMRGAREEMSFDSSSPLSAITAPPPISKVLHDVYQDETRANN
jgi:hypothetical protein